LFRLLLLLLLGLTSCTSPLDKEETKQYRGALAEAEKAIQIESSESLSLSNLQKAHEIREEAILSLQKIIRDNPEYKKGQEKLNAFKKAQSELDAKIKEVNFARVLELSDKAQKLEKEGLFDLARKQRKYAITKSQNLLDNYPSDNDISLKIESLKKEQERLELLIKKTRKKDQKTREKIAQLKPYICKATIAKAYNKNPGIINIETTGEIVDLYYIRTNDNSYSKWLFKCSVKSNQLTGEVQYVSKAPYLSDYSKWGANVYRFTYKILESDNDTRISITQKNGSNSTIESFSLNELK